MSLGASGPGIQDSKVSLSRTITHNNQRNIKISEMFESKESLKEGEIILSTHFVRWVCLDEFLVEGGFEVLAKKTVKT